MARYRATVHADGRPEEVFDYLADFSCVAEWDPGVTRASALSEDPRAVGARFSVVSRFLGREIPLEYRTVELQRPRRLVVRAETASVVSLDTIELRPAEGGTEVTYDAKLSLKGAYRLAALPIRLAFGRIGDRARAGLQEALTR
jgi:uncharacterized protein YndB with AHSA1/START domain